MFTRQPTNRPEIVWLGSALTWTAGFVDAVGYITLRDIYVANMSGNTVAVAIHLSKWDSPQAWAHSLPILAFVPGLVAGDAINEWCRQSKLRASIAPCLLLQAIGFTLFAFLADRHLPPHAAVRTYSGYTYAELVGLLAFSMGLQNGTLRRAGALHDVHTYVTGMLLAAAHGVTGYLFWLGRRARWSAQRLHRILRFSPRQRSLRAAALAALLWTLYLIGAIAGAIARPKYGINVILCPIAVVWVIALVDIVKPVASPEAKTKRARAQVLGTLCKR